MDKIKLLQARRQQLMQAGKNIREEINGLIDKDSFVELSSFSFSKNEFYGEEAEGEGVVTGFATINDYPFYIVAQNSAVLSGGVSKANCRKICKCLEQAEKNDSPVIYLLSSMGVQVGEGVNVLEGLAELIMKASRLRNHVSQYLVVNGEVYGQIAVLAGICDFTFFINKKSVLAANSPLVITATSGKNAGKFEVGGADGIKKAQLATFTVNDLSEVKSKIVALSDLLGNRMIDCDQLNASVPALNKGADGKAILSAFDKGTSIEFGASYEEQIKCVLGRIGGITVASVIFDGADGVELTAAKVRKINDFARFALSFNLPYITFVNTKGICADMQTNDSLVLKELGEYAAILDEISALKISVVYGKAIGLGYTMFAAKSMGYDYTYAFANAKIALFDGVQGAEIEYADDKKLDKAKLAEKYADENSDPINAAKDGYIDNIIEPAFVRQYLITFLQMLAE